MFVHRRILLASLILSVLLVGCAPNGSYIILITATPEANSVGGFSGGLQLESTQAPGSAPLNGSGAAPTPTFIPTPNPTREAVINPQENQIHIVQFGDTLSQIATSYGVTVDSIIQANQLTNQNLLEVGQSLLIPTAIQTIGPGFKMLPDSELVFGPGLKGFDVQEAVHSLPDSYLANYTEELNGRLWTGAEIIDRVSLEQSISPRLLLALLEYEGRWLSQSSVSADAALYPMGYYENPTQIYGLYRQLDWAGKMLQTGYYGWRERGLSAALLADGTRIGLDPTLNAGTAGVQILLAQTRSYSEWQQAVSHTGLFATFVALFGDPFGYAVEPLIPSGLTQPPLSFPWDPKETWYFTGGPHGGWGTGSAWAALDFVTGTEVGLGCEVSESYARAVADGVIARSEFGVVILDLDGDGFEGTGWTILYLHLSSEDRPVEVGQQVHTGDPIGHPSCEGGVSYATHLHIARRYNGEWIAVDCSDCLISNPTPQLNFDGWLGYSFGREYDGSLEKDDQYKEACVCREDLNTFSPQ